MFGLERKLNVLTRMVFADSKQEERMAGDDLLGHFHWLFFNNCFKLYARVSTPFSLGTLKKITRSKRKETHESAF